MPNKSNFTKFLTVAGIATMIINGGANAAENHDPKVAKLLDNWLAAVSSKSADKVAVMYDEDAVLLPTLWNEVQDMPSERLSYFKMFTALPEIKGTVNELHSKMLDDKVATNSGIYTFTFLQDGKKQSVPARFSFTYVLEGGEWKIAEHHSSRMPQPIEVKSN